MPSLSKTFNRYNYKLAQIGSAFGQGNYDIYRPDYTAANQTGVLIASNVSVRADTRAQQWAEPNLSGGMYYDLFLNRNLVKPGDILIPTGLSPTASTISTWPVITVGSITPLKPAVGFLSDVLGSVRDTTTNVIYNNVRWQWGRQGQPKSGLVDKQPISEILPYDKSTIIMYRRQGTGQPTPIITDHMLYYTLDGMNHWLRIVDIISIGNYTTMQVEEDAR